MGIFNKLFGASSDEGIKNEALPWIVLNEMNQLDEIIERSKHKKQLIFKHSTRCGISRMVKNQFEKAYALGNQVDLYYLDLLQHRDISNEIASRFSVYHESPQLLIVKNGLVDKHASHGAINELSLEDLV
ncbi:MAG: bacillithiol system redox-active protein YtxJ [Algicola sp.]|nr:bacillithiol system redox-active protein YtxJ [Algicola sp.]